MREVEHARGPQGQPVENPRTTLLDGQILVLAAQDIWLIEEAPMIFVRPHREFQPAMPFNSRPERHLFCSLIFESAGKMINLSGRISWETNGFRTTLGSIFSNADTQDMEYQRLQWMKCSDVVSDTCLRCKSLPICGGGCPRSNVHFSQDGMCEDKAVNVETVLKNYVVTML